MGMESRLDIVFPPVADAFVSGLKCALLAMGAMLVSGVQASTRSEQPKDGAAKQQETDGPEITGDWGLCTVTLDTQFSKWETTLNLDWQIRLSYVWVAQLVHYCHGVKNQCQT